VQVLLRGATTPEHHVCPHTFLPGQTTAPE
jgi:hypothetical protein